MIEKKQAMPLEKVDFQNRQNSQLSTNFLAFLLSEKSNAIERKHIIYSWMPFYELQNVD